MAAARNAHSLYTGVLSEVVGEPAGVGRQGHTHTHTNGLASDRCGPSVYWL